MKRTRLFLLIALLAICGTTGFTSCSSNKENVNELSNITKIADQVWTFSQSHPDGFTLDVRTMTEPTEGISVSYAATQGSHSRDQLDKVVRHALEHDGYVGGWYNSNDGLYYFDSSRVFPEDSLRSALRFGKENLQYSAFILSTYTVFLLRAKWPKSSNEAISVSVRRVTIGHFRSSNHRRANIGALASKWRNPSPTILMSKLVLHLHPGQLSQPT